MNIPKSLLFGTLALSICLAQSSNFDQEQFIKDQTAKNNALMKKAQAQHDEINAMPVDSNADEFIKHAEQGDANAQFKLGSCYQRGVGVDINVAAAIEWYRKSAVQGYPSGQNALGACYSNGVGVDKNRKIALDWFKKAAAQGDTTGIKNVAAEEENIKYDVEMSKTVCQNHKEYIDTVNIIYYYWGSRIVKYDEPSDQFGQMMNLSLVDILEDLKECSSSAVSQRAAQGLKHIKKMMLLEQMDNIDTLHKYGYVAQSELEGHDNLKQFVGKNCFELRLEIEKVLSYSPLQWLAGGGKVVIQPLPGSYTHFPDAQIGARIKASGKLVRIMQLKSMFTGKYSQALVVVPDNVY
jgi:TPR repeat protein